MKNTKSRHGKMARDQVKLSCKVGLETWARVGRAADDANMDIAKYLRMEIMDLVGDIELTMADYRKIESLKKQRKEKETI